MIFCFMSVVLFFSGRNILCCAKGDVAMPAVLSVISLTGVNSSLEVATPCSIGLHVVGGSQSGSTVVSAEAMLTLSIISSSCFLSLILCGTLGSKYQLTN